MQYFTTLFITALTAFGISTAALPVEQRQAATPCVEELPQYQQAKRNESSVFALQLVGSALGDEEVDDFCNKLNNGKLDKWGEQGLVLDSISKTVCAAQGSQPNATLALPNVVQANSKVFATQLLNAFNTSSPSTSAKTFQYLCNNLRYLQLSGFLLDDASIINSTCVASDDTLAPQPFSTNADVNTTAVKAYHVAASKLYAFQYASSAGTSEELNVMCAHAPAYKGKWAKLQLNPEVVKDTLCAVKEPISAEEGKAKMREWSSRQFLAVVTNISNKKGYRKWLCRKLSVDALETVGLDGQLVKDTVCQDAGVQSAEDDCED